MPSERTRVYLDELDDRFENRAKFYEELNKQKKENKMEIRLEEKELKEIIKNHIDKRYKINKKEINRVTLYEDEFNGEVDALIEINKGNKDEED
jgi:predicted transcriptional regulator